MSGFWKYILVASAAVVTPVCLIAWYLTGHHGLPVAGWVILGASAFAEGLYFVFLSRAYLAGDLSVVYPIARGTGPLVAVTAGLLVLREHLTAPELVGDPDLEPSRCILETELGATEIGLETQLKEIEQGFLDLLAQRPGPR